MAARLSCSSLENNLLAAKALRFWSRVPDGTGQGYVGPTGPGCAVGERSNNGVRSRISRK